MSLILYGSWSDVRTWLFSHRAAVGVMSLSVYNSLVWVKQIVLWEGKGVRFSNAGYRLEVNPLSHCLAVINWHPTLSNIMSITNADEQLLKFDSALSHMNSLLTEWEEQSAIFLREMKEYEERYLNTQHGSEPTSLPFHQTSSLQREEPTTSSRTSKSYLRDKVLKWN